MSPLSNISILMIADTVGGVWTYAAGLASSLAASGASVCLVTMGRLPRADQRQMLPASVQVIETDLALEWQDPEGRNFPEAHGFLGAIERRIKPDIVHLNSYREATFDWYAPVIVVAHSCVNSWGIACNDTAFLSEPRWRNYSKLVASGLDNADEWVSPTHAFGETLRHLYQPRSRGIVICNGATPTGDTAQPKKHLILAAGRMWDAAKNFSVLAEAGKDLDWPVCVAGPTAAKLPCGIKPLGELSHRELGSLMRQAQMFVSPARYEPFGLSVLEAAGAGCALVLSDVPTFRELWDGAALFVAPDDAGGLRAALSDLCNDQGKRLRLQRAALARARRYSMPSMADAYARLYRSLLSRRKRTNQEFAEVRA
jgi:glycosyltransferase involved in cell wall biosynthesis